MQPHLLALNWTRSRKAGLYAGVKAHIILSNCSIKLIFLLCSETVDEIQLYDIESLRTSFPSANVSNESRREAKCGHGESIKYNKIIGDEDYILNDLVRKPGSKKRSSEAFVRAGPRPNTHFDPKNVIAAVVTCGGLCPGLNNVIREIVHSLQYLYGVKKVLGIR